MTEQRPTAEPGDPAEPIRERVRQRYAAAAAAIANDADDACCGASAADLACCGTADACSVENAAFGAALYGRAGAAAEAPPRATSSSASSRPPASPTSRSA
jgi:hypothetical protein